MLKKNCADLEKTRAKVEIHFTHMKLTKLRAAGGSVACGESEMRQVTEGADRLQYGADASEGRASTSSDHKE